MKFTTFLAEGISSTHFQKAIAQIVSYLEKHIGAMHPCQSTEYFQSDLGSGSGIRYFLDDGTSIRFNWLGSGNGANNLHSITLWDGSSKDPSYNILGLDGVPLSDVSLVQVLPLLVQAIKSPQAGDFAAPTTEGLSDTQQVLIEDPYDDVIAAIKAGPISNYNAAKMGRNQERIFNAILSKHGDIFAPKSDAAGRTRYSLIGNVDSIDRKDIMSGVATPKAGRPSTGVTVVTASRETSQIGNERTAAKEVPTSNIPYDEQLQDIVTIVQAVVGGASNFAIVTGPGGLGKTHTIEKALGDMGLQDGAGYFKNTGSSSPSGLYKTLFINKTGIVLIDDCDAIFDTQEGRNLLKAALDTKKSRKLVWGKSASWLFDPADDVSQEEAEQAIAIGAEPERFPRYFNFEGRVIMTSNLSTSTLDPDGALRTRGFVVSLAPTEVEVYEHIKKIIDDIEPELKLTHDERVAILDVISKQSRTQLNVRILIRAFNIAASGVANWERIVTRYA